MIRAGVYIITCLANERTYIGSSVHLGKRWQEHQQAFRRNGHKNRHMQRAWDKHSGDTFTFNILLYCDPENCLMYEQIALHALKPKFNICQEVTSSLGVKRSEKTKQRISEAKKGVKIHTEDSIRKIKEFQIGRPTSIITKETMSKARLGRSVVSDVRGLIAQGVRDCDIARSLEIDPSTVNKIRHRKRHAE